MALGLPFFFIKSWWLGSSIGIPNMYFKLAAKAENFLYPNTEADRPVELVPLESRFKWNLSSLISIKNDLNSIGLAN